MTSELCVQREQLIKEVVEEENNIRRLRKGIDVLIADVRSNALDGSRMRCGDIFPRATHPCAFLGICNALFHI